VRSSETLALLFVLLNARTNSSPRNPTASTLYSQCRRWSCSVATFRCPLDLLMSLFQTLAVGVGMIR